MSVVDLSNYKVTMVEKICLNKFQNDLMLELSNFSRKAITYITTTIKEDIADLEREGIIFDNRLINIGCTMYLGIAWSMYRKGKKLGQEDENIKTITKYNGKDNDVIQQYVENSGYMDIIQEIVLRYYTLYFSRHLEDIMSRMEITDHPFINNKEELKNIILRHLSSYAVKVIIVGIKDKENILKN
ncbi:hypothetical protein [Dethiothermospora halolimnae]|uniref:hypothetical protein n=1 Tax=Dethiothermospora halolimnae TaxID=3114390 RepID=UPI003CCBBCC8